MSPPIPQLGASALHEIADRTIFATTASISDSIKMDKLALKIYKDSREIEFRAHVLGQSQTMKLTYYGSLAFYKSRT
jgi:hypothetical protein